MEEIKVGEYVRTINGEIGIFKGYNANSKSQWKHKIEFQGVKTWKYCAEGYIVKHSKNIIDLIEVGDYVNGYKAIGVTLDPAPSGKCVDIDCDKPSYESYLFEEQIYSIVTKEQFASMEYSLED